MLQAEKSGETKVRRDASYCVKVSVAVVVGTRLVTSALKLVSPSVRSASATMTLREFGMSVNSSRTSLYSTEKVRQLLLKPTPTLSLARVAFVMS